MKLYLSSYRIPDTHAFAELVGKELSDISVALIPNASDYYSERQWDITVRSLVTYMQELGLAVTVVDLREFSDASMLKDALGGHDVVWAMGGNTYMLRYEMKRSGFDKIIGTLVDEGMVYGGDSAGALVAGVSIAGVELADDPSFAEELVLEGLGLLPAVIFPHADDQEFANLLPMFRQTHKERQIVELTDSQALVVNGSQQDIVGS